MTCYVGVEPTGTRPCATPVDAFRRNPTYPVGGLCSLLFGKLPTASLINEFCIPIHFLNSGIKLTIGFRERVRMLTGFGNIDSGNVLYFRSCKAVLPHCRICCQIAICRAT